MVKRTNCDALVHERRGQGCRDFYTLEINLTNLGARGCLCRPMEGKGGLLLGRCSSSTSKLPSCTRRQKGRNCSVCVRQQGKSFNSNKKKAHGIGSQEDTTQNQPQSHQFPATGSVSQHAEHIVLQHLLPLVSWAVLYCSSLMCFISCRLRSLASLWSTIGKG